MIGTVEQIMKYLYRFNQDKTKKFEVKEYKEKRSLNANSYYWHLVNELGNILQMNKEDVHFLLLQKYGQSEIVSVLADINVSGYFKYYIEAGESTAKRKII